ncbi:unnamed protein product [Tetraodon nigroviridis]|uniref:(spotted green pufferfish) hypothetical protein n=1 Tax=Tetraodon nigroviridis TaxID=99883 RepID=Q4SVS2_TETNG|nr:unnamed protein product [Tetraodon nigroviridis]
MELKKSLSDTERALRSYGAVSETAWTTDKGGSPRSRGGVRVGLGSGSAAAARRLIGDSRRAGIRLLLKGRLTSSSTCTVWFVRV